MEDQDRFVDEDLLLNWKLEAPNSDDDYFKYKLLCYNNLSISIVTRDRLNAEYRYFYNSHKHKSDFNDNLEPVFWDSNWEVKGKDDNELFKHYWSLINCQKNCKISMLTCSNIEYYNEGDLMMNSTNAVMPNHYQCFHTK